MEIEDRLPKTIKDQLKEKELQFEIAILEASRKFSPDNFEVLFHLGNAYTKIGEYVKGLEIDIKLTLLAPENSVVHYNLACSFSLLGRVDESLSELEKSLSLGYAEFDFIRKDKDMEEARKDKRFEEILVRFEKQKSST
ncbi:MAG: hypothetical protein ABIH42_11290 [Planctomycetota bacterium]